jgi:predicted Zn-dependent protease with MMP-like domain
MNSRRSPISHDELKKEAIRALDSLPAQFRRRLHNVVVTVEKRPRPDQLREMGLDPREDTLYGLYEGIPLSERSTFDPPALPDKITIFAEPLLQDFPDPAELREQVRITVLHEIAHFFGMDEDDIEDLGY